MFRRINRGFRIFLVAALAGGSVSVHAASGADAYVAEARHYVSQGKVQEAKIQLKNALQSDPSSVKARLMLGILYLRTGDMPGAQKELERAARLGAPKQDWMMGLGQALLMQQDFNGVLTAIQPDESMTKQAQAMALAIRGDAYFGLKDSANAEKAFDAALSLQPSNPSARLGKARLLAQAGKREQAIAELTQVIADYPDHAETRLARAELYRSLGELDKAIEDFSVAIAKEPKNARAYTGRALAYIASHQFGKAQQDVKDLRKNVGDLPIVHYFNALMDFQEKKFDKASDELQQVLRVAPDNPQAQLLYGVVSYARGEYTIANDYLSRIVVNMPQAAELRNLLGAARLKLNAPDSAIEALQPLLDEKGNTGVRTLALIGTAYMMKGDSEKGAEYLQKAVELAPDQAALRTQLAAGQIALGDSKDAISELESAVSLDQHLVQADVLLVLSYLKEKEYNKAIEYSELLEKRMPNSPIPPNLTGLAYLAQQKFDQAEEKFNLALKVDPKFVVAEMNLARMGVAEKKPDLAREHYRKALEIDPANVGAMLGLAALDTTTGNMDGAEEWLTKANQANPKAPAPMLLLAETALKRGRPLQATNILSGLSAEQAKSGPALRVKGMALLQSGEFSNAKAVFEQLVRVSPNSVEAWFQLARSEAATNDNAAALESFDKAISLDPEHKLALPWVGKGELELRQKRYDEALALALKMQQFFPTNAMAYELEAAAYRGKGDVQKAVDAMAKAVKADGNPKRVNLYANVLAASGKTEKAVSVLQDWLGKHPDDGVSWSTLGMIFQSQNDDSQAVKAYEKSLKFDAGNPVVMNNMAWLYLPSNPKRSLELAKQAYEIAPERAEIVDTYGWVLFKQGEHAKALSVLQEALLAAPKNPEIALHVVEALHALRRDSEAKSIAQRIVKEHPGTKSATSAKQWLSKLKP